MVRWLRIDGYKLGTVSTEKGKKERTDDGRLVCPTLPPFSTSLD